jgi:2',3'-cyclic-nucleotide 2'-phosphodiesterase (5'-nucleotidase family)
MVETARHWMAVIEKEDPDIIVGLFHSGWNPNENGRMMIIMMRMGPWRLPGCSGFDIIFADMITGL